MEPHDPAARRGMRMHQRDQIFQVHPHAVLLYRGRRPFHEDRVDQRPGIEKDIRPEQEREPFHRDKVRVTGACTNKMHGLHYRSSDEKIALIAYPDT
jgi:hypothetical protein